MKKFAMVFPGQGSQSVGMLAELATQFPIVLETFNVASEQVGFDLWQLCQDGPEATLNQTANTQPALLASSYAIWQVWRELTDTLPNFVAGHSLGEYTALVCANVISFPQAVKLVQQRGEFMQQAVVPGAGSMAAILGLEDTQIASLCREAAQGAVVAPANFNSIGQTVIAGHKAAVERAGQLMQAAGARKVVELAVSVPSHCALMDPAAEKLTHLLQALEFKAPTIAIVCNVTGQIENNPAQLKQNLLCQLTEPVQWVKTIQTMAHAGVTEVIECGPGKVLTGLNKRIDKNLTYRTINEPETLAGETNV